MTDPPPITTQFNLLPVAQAAIACGLVGATAAALWQFPVVQELTRSPGFKKALRVGITKIIDGGGGSTIAAA